MTYFDMHVLTRGEINPPPDRPPTGGGTKGGGRGEPARHHEKEHSSVFLLACPQQRGERGGAPHHQGPRRGSNLVTPVRGPVMRGSYRGQAPVACNSSKGGGPPPQRAQLGNRLPNVRAHGAWLPVYAPTWRRARGEVCSFHVLAAHANVHVPCGGEVCSFHVLAAHANVHVPCAPMYTWRCNSARAHAHAPVRMYPCACTCM